MRAVFNGHLHWNHLDVIDGLPVRHAPEPDREPRRRRAGPRGGGARGGAALDEADRGGGRGRRAGALPVRPPAGVKRPPVMEITTDVTLPYPRERVFAHLPRPPGGSARLPAQHPRLAVKQPDRPGRRGRISSTSGPAAARSPRVARSFLQRGDAGLDRPRHLAARPTFICRWRTEVHAFPGALSSSGCEPLRRGGGRDAHRVPRGSSPATPPGCRGCRRLLARSINGTVEKVFVGKIGENLVGVGEGIGKLLARDRA